VNPAEIVYTFRTPYPDTLQRGRAQSVQMPVYRDGAVSPPTIVGSSFSLRKPDGTFVVEGAAITLSSSIATYALTALDLPTTLDLGEGYQEVWLLVLADGTPRTVDREAALCLRPLVPVITDLDLIATYPNLNEFRGNAISHWQGFIDEAWKQILGRLIGEGHLPYLVKSGWSFRAAHIELVFALGFRWLALNQARGNFLELARTHAESFEAKWKQINFRVDDDHDGLVDDNEARRGAGSAIVHINAAPERHFVNNARW
jgi:hypothetical protein